MNHATRVALYKVIEQRRESKVVCYVTGDRQGLGTQIGNDAIDPLVDHLDQIGPTHRITFILHTNGGDPLAAWTIVNLVIQFCDELEVMIPRKSLSAGTLLTLGAQRIIMTKQAVLGPIDPSISGPLAPTIPGAPPSSRAPVSVEAVQGYLDFSRVSCRIRKQSEIGSGLRQLAEKVHPLILGHVFRARSQTRFLASRLLEQQGINGRHSKRIIDFLSSESGSHDYTISRREARNLGLNIEKPNDQEYQTIKALYESIKAELQLGTPYNPAQLLGANQSVNYSFIRGLIESTTGGSHRFVSEGVLSKAQVQVAPGIFQNGVTDERQFEGWRK